MPDGGRDDRDTLIRLSTLVEKLAIEVHDMGVKVDALRMDKTLASMEPRVSRLESIVYGIIAAVSLEALGLIGWAITHWSRA